MTPAGALAKSELAGRRTTLGGVRTCASCWLEQVERRFNVYSDTKRVRSCGQLHGKYVSTACRNLFPLFCGACEIFFTGLNVKPARQSRYYHSMRILFSLLFMASLFAQNPPPAGERRPGGPPPAPKNLKLLKPEEI